MDQESYFEGVGLDLAAHILISTMASALTQSMKSVVRHLKVL